MVGKINVVLENEEILLSENEIDKLFSTEVELAGLNAEDAWNMPCGHDCCTCDSECK